MLFPSLLFFLFYLSFSLFTLPIQFYQTIFCKSLNVTDLGLKTIFLFHCTKTFCYDEIVLMPLFSSNLWFTWELSISKNWKRHHYIYLIFLNRRRNFLNVAKRRKRIVIISKREKSFRKGDHSLKIIKKVSFFFYLNTIVHFLDYLWFQKNSI